LTSSRARGTIGPNRARTTAQLEAPMFGMGPMELGIILVIVVVLFGARRLPELGSGVGKAIKNFKSGISGDDEIDVTPEKEKVTQGENSEGSSS
jgi:sec-independent protein translocase protein TatA